MKIEETLPIEIFPKGEQRWVRILVKNSEKCCELFSLYSKENPNYKVTSVTLNDGYNPTLESIKRIEAGIIEYLGEIKVSKSDIQGVKILIQKEVLEFLIETQKDLKSAELQEEEVNTTTYTFDEVVEFLDWYFKDNEHWNNQSSLDLIRSYLLSNTPKDSKFIELDFYNILRQVSAYNSKMINKFLTWSMDRKMMNNAGA